jgi:hypothetical protein
MVFFPSSPLHRFLHPDSQAKDSTQYHIIAWKAGLRMIKTHPLFGVGLGNFKRLMYLYVPPETTWTSLAHNTFLEAAAELGLPVFGVFVGILVFTYRSLGGAGRRARITGDRRMYLATVGLQAGFVGYLVGACFVSVQYTKLFWLVIFLSMCLPQLTTVRSVRGRAESSLSLAPELVHKEKHYGWLHDRSSNAAC